MIVGPFKFLVNIYIIILIVRWIIETFMQDYVAKTWFSRLKDITDPVLDITRRLLPTTFNGIDFTYLVAILLVKLFSVLLIWIF